MKTYVKKHQNRSEVNHEKHYFFVIVKTTRNFQSFICKKTAFIEFFLIRYIRILPLISHCNKQHI